MMFNLDTGLHLAEVVAIIFWVGKTWGDVKWIKDEVRHLRELCEYNFGISGGKK